LENAQVINYLRKKITVLVAVNIFEIEKRKLLVIGKSKCPKSFKDVTSVPVIYENNNAWMTSEI